MSVITKITKDDFDAALDAANAVLETGGIIIYPTDTVYGIGCDATNPKAIEKVRKIKGIDDKPLSVMVGDFGVIEYYCVTGIWEDITLKKFLPGPYTFILKKQREIPASNTDKLGVRIPENLFCQFLAQKFGRPIISTSANRTGEEAPTKFKDISKEVLDAVDFAIDQGETKYQKHSMVFDLVDHKMLRKGGKDISLI